MPSGVPAAMRPDVERLHATLKLPVDVFTEADVAALVRLIDEMLGLIEDQRREDKHG